MTWHVEWALFTTIAFTLVATGYRYTSSPEDKMLIFGGGFIFWLSALGQWVFDQTGVLRLFGVLPHLAPLMACFAWFMQALGAYVDTIGHKKRINA